MTASDTNTACQHLTFALGQDTYAIEISQVREVLDFTQITRVPGMPEFARGIINLREHTVPVFDLNLKFGREEMAPKDGTCIVIAQIPVGEETGLIGILADEVYEVLFLEPEPTESLEQISSSPVSTFVKGIGRQEAGFILVLSLETLFSRDEVETASITAAV